MLRVIDVDYLGKYRLKLSFNNGEILTKARRNYPGKLATKARRHEEKVMRSGRSLQAKLPDYTINNL